MDSSGKIHHLTEEESAATKLRYDAETAAGEKHEMTPITEKLARFMASRSKLFRETWGRKFSRGLTPVEKNGLQTMLFEFLHKEKDAQLKKLGDIPMQRHQAAQIVMAPEGERSHERSIAAEQILGERIRGQRVEDMPDGS